MRIIVGGMNHESNTLNPIITGAEDFVVFHGEEMFHRGMLPYYSSTGIIETLRAEGCEVIPTVLARAVPNGVVSKHLYLELKAELMERVRAAQESGPVHGVCLGLHGSMKVEGLGCAEGDLLAGLRKLLPDIPVSVALDMHATVTEDMLRNADAFVGYKTAPHVDCRETGSHAAKMLLLSLRTGRKLTSSCCKLPMLIAGEKSESQAEPMKSLIARCGEVEQKRNILAASYILGFPWADNEHNGVSALVTTLDDQILAEAEAVNLARAFWDERASFKFRSEYYDSEQSLRVAYNAVLKDGLSPVFVSDSGDNPTAGATGDATELLERVLASIGTVDTLPTPLLYSGFYAPEACAACLRAGEGASLEIGIGAFWDKQNGSNQRLAVSVVRIARGYGPYSSDLALVKHRNMLIVLTSKHIGFGDDELLPALGVDPAAHCVVIVKLGYLEACFRDIAARAIMATSKGCSNELLETIPYRRVRRPIYPLDTNMSYVPKPMLV